MNLLDVNVLLAIRYEVQPNHLKAMRWIQRVKSICIDTQPFATCSIVELGFIRIASSQAVLAGNLETARTDLQRLKTSLGLKFLSDDLDGNQLPDWVTKSKQTTDGHLLELASRYGMQLATLDSGIPGALLIPEYDRTHGDPSSTVHESRPPFYGAVA